MGTSVLENMLTRSNGYPLDFKIDHIVEDSLSGKYFPANLSHLAVIRNWKDGELDKHLQTYQNTLNSKEWRKPSFSEFVCALRNIAEDEQIRRAKFRSGEIRLEDINPLVYAGNLPRIIAVM